MFHKLGYASSASSGHEAETVIGRASEFNGSLRADGDVEVFGSFEGELQATGTLVVRSGGEVRSDARARHVSVAGLVVGDIRAAGRIEIATGARVTGDISCSSLVLDEGAIFVGACAMLREGDEARLPLPTSSIVDQGLEPSTLRSL